MMRDATTCLKEKEEENRRKKNKIGQPYYQRKQIGKALSVSVRKDIKLKSIYILNQSR